MAKNPAYPIEESLDDKELRFYFTSTGVADIVKVIAYTRITRIGEVDIFNLGFGDYNVNDDAISDVVISNNGDVHKVFNTVLNSVPAFFSAFPDAQLLVQGSDSSQEYINDCRLFCRKNCGDTCRNANRRIITYRNFINKHYDQLGENYTFMGAFNNGTCFVPYTKHT